MRERCHRCYTILTSEDKHHYGISFENCQCDMEWEEHERDQPIKSAYWRWRAICSVCAGCGAQLLDTEVYACTSFLDLWMVLDPNFRLTGETDD